MHVAGPLLPTKILAVNDFVSRRAAQPKLNMPKTFKLIGEEGDNVGFVTLSRLLGQPGEQGEVWLAHAGDHKDVAFAVKLSKRSIVAKTDRAYDKFVREFHNLASCIH